MARTRSLRHLPQKVEEVEAEQMELLVLRGAVAGQGDPVAARPFQAARTRKALVLLKQDRGTMVVVEYMSVQQPLKT